MLRQLTPLSNVTIQPTTLNNRPNKERDTKHKPKQHQKRNVRPPVFWSVVTLQPCVAEGQHPLSQNSKMCSGLR
jgi:hypothetical protein